MKAAYYDGEGQIVKRNVQPPTEFTTDPAVIQVELFQEALIEMQNDRKAHKESIFKLHEHIDIKLKGIQT